MKLKKFIKFGESEREVLKMIGLGTLVLASFVFPGLPLALKPFFKNQGPKKFNKTIKRLEEKGVIYLSADRVKMTKKGERLMREIQIKDIKIERPEKWDKVWHLVSYDIPEKYKKERDWFRQTLERWNFYQVQKSLWVCPFECREEIAILAQTLKISPYVAYMNTDHLPVQKNLEKYFGLVD